MGVRPNDDEIVPLVDSLAWQASHCRAAGSPVAGSILDALREGVASGGPLAALVPEETRFGLLPGLRLMATVHRLALTRRAPRVALHLPTLGGTPPPARALDDFQAAVVTALSDHPRETVAGLAQTPQTNETGRSALLRAALSHLPDRPVRLRELAASAGLNLRADHLPGLPGLESGALPPILDRIGCDLSPVDPSTPEGRALLSSYVWVDDVERFGRLTAALAVASAVPARVERADAAQFASALTLVDGTTTVVWHSAMWLYPEFATRQAILAAIGDLGSTASASAGLAHVSWEWAPAGFPSPDPFALVMRRWHGLPDDGRPRLLATGVSHGYRAHASDRWLDRDPLDPDPLAE